MIFGEMTITLDDDSTPVGIPVMMTDTRWMLVSLLGMSPPDAQDELGLVRGTSVRLEWLCFKFFDVTDVDSERYIQCTARAYLFTWWTAIHSVTTIEGEFLSNIWDYLKTLVRFHCMLGELLY